MSQRVKSDWPQSYNPGGRRTQQRNSSDTDTDCKCFSHAFKQSNGQTLLHWWCIFYKLSNWRNIMDLKKCEEAGFEEEIFLAEIFLQALVLEPVHDKQGLNITRWSNKFIWFDTEWPIRLYGSHGSLTEGSEHCSRGKHVNRKCQWVGSKIPCVVGSVDCMRKM